MFSALAFAWGWGMKALIFATVFVVAAELVLLTAASVHAFGGR
jgi:hypothetical protein